MKYRNCLIIHRRQNEARRNQILKGSHHTDESKLKLKILATKPRILRVCKHCENTFEVIVTDKSKMFCSVYCSRKYGTRRGTSQSDEAKSKISKSVSRKFSTPEYKSRLSKAHLGHYVSSDTRKKLSLLKKGVKHHNWGKNITKETKQKISDTLKRIGHRPPPHHICWTEKSRQKFSLAMKGRKFSESHRNKISIGRIRAWQIPENRERFIQSILKASAVRPNKFEVKVGNLLNELYPMEFEYTGNGSKIIGGMSPDFTSTKDSYVIEAYGDYWHMNDNPQNRIDRFREVGFDCLIIWESELKDTNKLVQKILSWRTV